MNWMYSINWWINVSHLCHAHSQWCLQTPILRVWMFYCLPPPPFRNFEKVWYFSWKKEIFHWYMHVITSLQFWQKRGFEKLASQMYSRKTIICSFCNSALSSFWTMVEFIHAILHPLMWTPVCLLCLWYFFTCTSHY